MLTDVDSDLLSTFGNAGNPLGVFLGGFTRCYGIPLASDSSTFTRDLGAFPQGNTVISPAFSRAVRREINCKKKQYLVGEWGNDLL